MKKMIARFKGWYMKNFQKDKWEAMQRYRQQVAELRKLTGATVKKTMLERVYGGTAIREARIKRFKRNRKKLPVKVVHVGEVVDYSHFAPRSGNWKRMGKGMCGVTWTQHPADPVYVHELNG